MFRGEAHGPDDHEDEAGEESETEDRGKHGREGEDLLATLLARERQRKWLIAAPEGEMRVSLC